MYQLKVCTVLLCFWFFWTVDLPIHERVSPWLEDRHLGPLCLASHLTLKCVIIYNFLQKQSGCTTDQEECRRQYPQRMLSVGCHAYLSRPDHSSRLRVLQLQGFLNHSIFFHLEKHTNKSIWHGAPCITAVSLWAEWVSSGVGSSVQHSVTRVQWATYIYFLRYS